MKQLENRISAIEVRNERVQQDKLWETSVTRKLSIAALTYVTVLVYLQVIGNENPFINALVPAAGFFLSTLALKNIRRLWERRG